jgi:hypothetical protein
MNIRKQLIGKFAENRSLERNNLRWKYDIATNKHNKNRVQYWVTLSTAINLWLKKRQF